MRWLLTVGLIGLAVASQTSGDEKTKVVGPPPGSAEVKFNDGSVMRMQFSDEVIEVTTAYGKLKIPAKDVRRLELATRIPDAIKTTIDQAIIDLGSSQYKLREVATRNLAEAKVYAYPALMRAAASDDAEVSKRANELITKLKEEVPAEKLKFREKDIIYTDDSMFAGKIEVSSLKANTNQFGVVQVKLSDIGSIAFLHGGRETELKMDGQYAQQTERWLDTKLDFTEGARIAITADGEIDMYASAGYFGQYVGTPKGKKAWPGNPGLQWEPGTLIGKFGESGKIFVIGEKYEAQSQSGRLYIRAGGNPYNVQTQGEYKVKIQGGTKAN